MISTPPNWENYIFRVKSNIQEWLLVNIVVKNNVN